MKKLLIVAAAAMLTFSAIGCECCPLHRWKKAAICGDPCEPVSACNTCGPTASPMMGDTYLSPPQIITPGPVTTQ